MLIALLLAGAAAAAAAEAPPIPGRYDLPSDVGAAPLAALVPKAADAEGLYGAMLDASPAERTAAASQWCASLEATARGGDQAGFWGAALAGTRLLEELLARSDDPGVRRWVFFRVFACSAAACRDSLLTRPRHPYWIEPWLRLEELRDRAANDADPVLKEFMERYAPASSAPDWRLAKKEAAGVLRRVASSYRGSKPELKEAWRRCEAVERTASATLRRALALARADRALSRGERKALEANLRAHHAHRLTALWGNAFMKVFTKNLGEQAALTYGASLRPITLGWPRLETLYARGHAERGRHLAGLGRVEEASAELLRALSLDPSRKEAGVALRALQTRDGTFPILLERDGN